MCARSIARHRILAAHEPGDDRVDGGLLLLLVLGEPLEQEPADPLQLLLRLARARARRAGRPRCGSAASSGANSRCSARNRSADVRSGPADRPAAAASAARGPAAR